MHTAVLKRAWWRFWRKSAFSNYALLQCFGIRSPYCYCCLLLKNLQLPLANCLKAAPLAPPTSRQGAKEIGKFVSNRRLFQIYMPGNTILAITRVIIFIKQILETFKRPQMVVSTPRQNCLPTHSQINSKSNAIFFHRILCGCDVYIRQLRRDNIVN